MIQYSTIQQNTALVFNQVSKTGPQIQKAPGIQNRKQLYPIFQIILYLHEYCTLKLEVNGNGWKDDF